MATDVAEQTNVETEQTETGPDAATTGKFGLSGNGLKIFALLAFVMIAEAGVFYFLGITPGAKSETAGSEQGESPEAADTQVDSQGDVVEVEINSLNVTNNRAAADSIIHITFTPVAVVSRDQRVAFDKAANKDHKARVRQAIVKVARSSSLEDLRDPNLTTIRRLIREEVNKVLRQSYIIEVIIPDFKTMEQ